ncbi:DNA-damage-inducible protein J [Enterococcus sp. AZ194]|uniref:type II toxin-antitoxin system RelB/DinJ family antitoxin n=1 Tax=Enterococcus sp. AZ194 TaxID=2774629 RepID=UPI003F20732B
MTELRLNMIIDKELKEQAEELYLDLGMDLSTAITIFLKQSIREQQLPFIPSREHMGNFPTQYSALHGTTTKVFSVGGVSEDLNDEN